jgi:hypothetical protein
LVTVPTAGMTVQMAPLLLVPLTLALNVANWPEVSEAVAGVTTIETGAVSEIIALALLVLSAELAAVTVTDWAIVTNAGAV